MLIYSVYVFFIVLMAMSCLVLVRNARNARDYWAALAAENAMMANHWRQQFNDVVEGSDGAWARRMISENEALSKGLDEAIDDHMQDQESWEEARTQYKTTISDLQDSCHDWNTRYCAVRDELADVKQTALDMQIELGRPEILGEHDVIAKDAVVTVADDAQLKDPFGTVIGTVDGVRNTPEGIVVDMTFNDNVPWAGKKATGIVPTED